MLLEVKLLHLYGIAANLDYSILIQTMLSYNLNIQILLL